MKAYVIPSPPDPNMTMADKASWQTGHYDFNRGAPDCPFASGRNQDLWARGWLKAYVDTVAVVLSSATPLRDRQPAYRRLMSYRKAMRDSWTKATGGSILPTV